jgi:galactokinase
MMDINLIELKFKEIYGVSPSIYRSPGRINIIGEHTDYNEGFVLPAAIDKAVYVAISKRTDQEVHLYATKYQESFKTHLSKIAPSEKQWVNYILGVVSEIHKLGHSFTGFNILVSGDVPGGAGLSSSAALECAVAFALNDIYVLNIEKIELAHIAQMAEHHFTGVMCGIMDQFASLFGKKNHAIMLDCKTLAFRYIPVNLIGYKFVLFNTNVKHNLASSAYNDRRASCYKGVVWVKEKYIEVNSLRDISLEMLDECVKNRDLDVYAKCKFVVEEIARLKLACQDLEDNNLKSLGERMFETHTGLSEAYEVSCEELDFLVDQVKNNPDVLGARMMGGGFGGCTINLVKEDAIDLLSDKLKEAYLLKFGIELTTYEVIIEDGTGKIK